MLTHDRAGAAERTAAAPAEPLSTARRADEFSARRRGAVRTFFFKNPRIMDVVVVLCNILAGSGPFIGGNGAGFNFPAYLTLLAASSTVLMFRRYRPLTVLAVLAVLEVVNVILVPNAGNVGTGLWFGLYAVATAYRSVFSFAAAAVASAPLVAYLLIFYRIPSEDLPPDGPGPVGSVIISIVLIILTNIVATGIGTSVRRGREHEGELRQWAERNAQLASVAERNRIAREMHDVVAHSLTVMVALSDGAAVVVKRNPEQAGEVLGQLSQTGRTALADMRRVLGVLRQEGGGGLSPQPDHTDLGGLIEGFRQAGLPLTVTQSGPPLPTDPALQLTIYRIVQESLTNVLRYGTAVSRVRVLIDHDPVRNAIAVQVSDDGRGSVDSSMGTGQGIVGMRERARIYAGTVTAGPGQLGGWSVDVLLHPGTGDGWGRGDTEKATDIDTDSTDTGERREH